MDEDFINLYFYGMIVSFLVNTILLYFGIKNFPKISNTRKVIVHYLFFISSFAGLFIMIILLIILNFAHNRKQK